jgi:Rrf2 family protein
LLELSTTAGYALLALGYLERARDRWVLANEIAEHTNVAPPYLSRILHMLAKAGLVKAKRGYRGGFCLARQSTEIAVLDIVSAVEHQPRVQRCLLGLVECSDHTACPVHLMWKTARSQIEASLACLTLDQVANAVSMRGEQAVIHHPVGRDSASPNKKAAICPGTKKSEARPKRNGAARSRRA